MRWKRRPQLETKTTTQNNPAATGEAAWQIVETARYTPNTTLTDGAHQRVARKWYLDCLKLWESDLRVRSSEAV